MPCFLAYFADLKRPVEDGSKPDSKVLVGVYPLHTCLFNLKRCNGKGGLLSSGDDHIFTFSSIKLQKVIVRPYTELVELVNICLAPPLT